MTSILPHCPVTEVSLMCVMLVWRNAVSRQSHIGASAKVQTNWSRVMEPYRPSRDIFPFPI